MVSPSNTLYDYTQCTLEELHEIYRHVDQEKYPEQTQTILRVIAEKENSLNQQNLLTVSVPTRPIGIWEKRFDFILQRTLRTFWILFAVSLFSVMLLSYSYYDFLSERGNFLIVVIVIYFRWLGGVITGDWGATFTGEPVLDAILSRFPVSLELMILAVLIMLLLAVPMALLSAYRPGGKLDHWIAAFGFLTISVPSFTGAIVLIYIFALYFKILPVTGYEKITEDFWANLRAFVLPSLTLALSEWTVLMRVLRADMMLVLQEDFIVMARAKGLSPFRILFAHALRPASFSLISVLGLQMGAFIGGLVLIERIFALPGVGYLLFQAALERDFALVPGCLLFIALCYLLIGFVLDLLYASLDPRLKTRQF